jgi:hypothetical protein
LPEDHVKKIKKMAKSRKASAFIRDAVLMALDKTDDLRLTGSIHDIEVLSEGCSATESDRTTAN